MAEVQKTNNMPNFKKNTSPAMKRSGFKMRGYSYPGTSPLKQEKRKYTEEQLAAILKGKIANWNKANPDATQDEMNAAQARFIEEVNALQ